MKMEDVLTKQLQDYLTMIKDSCKKIHKDRYLISFTNHDYCHSERMVGLITSLCEGSDLLKRRKNSINDFEAFILLSSIYLHDIGIQIYEDRVLEDFVKKYKQEKPEIESEYKNDSKDQFIRNNHHLLSGYWISDALTNKHLLPIAYYGDRELAEYVKRVVVSHGLDFATNEKYTKTIDYEGKSIRIGLLCELLSLADSLDCDKRRIDYDKLKYSDVPNISKLHWMKHYYCNSVSIKDHVVRLSFQFPSGLSESEKWAYKTYFKHETEYWIVQNQRKYLKNLSKYHANFDINISVDYGDKDPLDEEQYLAIEEGIAEIAEKEESPLKISPITIAIGILEKNGKVVLVRRRQKENMLEWQFPAGIVKANQNAERRVVEEFEDETGIKVKIRDSIGKRIHPDTKTLSKYYALDYVSGELKNGDEKENSDCKWIELDEYKGVITSDLFLGAERYLRKCDEINIEQGEENE